MKLETFAEAVAQKTASSPLAIHMNAIGLIRLGDSNDERLESFEGFLLKVEQLGGNIAIPSYSYSYTKNEPYSIADTRSDIGLVSDWLRQRHPARRTKDALFSYLLFGKDFSADHLNPIGDYASFGADSLVDELYHKDAYLGAIGGVLSYLTEIHYLEHQLDVPYRMNKTFKGTLVDLAGNTHNQSIEYFCRRLDYNMRTDYTILEDEMKQEGLVDVWCTKDGDFSIEVIRIKPLLPYLKMKLAERPFYLCRPMESGPDGRGATERP